MYQSDILWYYFLGTDSGSPFWEKDILSLFLLDGTIYGAGNQNKTGSPFAGLTY